MHLLIDIVMRKIDFQYVRTTVSIADHLLKRAKEEAFAKNCSLGQIIDEALQTAFAARQKKTSRPGLKPLITYGGRGLQPSVHLDSSSELLSVMEGQ